MVAESRAASRSKQHLLPQKRLAVDGYSGLGSMLCSWWLAWDMYLYYMPYIQKGDHLTIRMFIFASSIQCVWPSFMLVAHPLAFPTQWTVHVDPVTAWMK